MNERPPAAEAVPGGVEDGSDRLFDRWFEEFKQKLLSAEHLDYVINQMKETELASRKENDSSSDATLLPVEINQRFTEDRSHCPDINDDDLISEVGGMTFYKTMLLDFPEYRAIMETELCTALQDRDPRVQRVEMSAGDGGGYVLNEIRMTVLVDPSKASE